MKTPETEAFSPRSTITPSTASALMRIEAVKQEIGTMPITARVLASLRETARLFSTHYSTMIEGNRLTQDQVSKVIGKHEHFPGRERDEKEVLGYYDWSTPTSISSARRCRATLRATRLWDMVKARGYSAATEERRSHAA